MKICIPSQDDRGLSSEVSAHFGAAPWFTFVDTTSGELNVVENPSCHSTPGMCHHTRILQARGTEAVVAGGIGKRAWQALREAGIDVFAPDSKNVGSAVEEIQRGDVLPTIVAPRCGHGHHRRGGGHA